MENQRLFEVIHLETFGISTVRYLEMPNLKVGLPVVTTPGVSHGLDAMDFWGIQKFHSSQGRCLEASGSS